MLIQENFCLELRDDDLCAFQIDRRSIAMSEVEMRPSGYMKCHESLNEGDKNFIVLVQLTGLPKLSRPPLNKKACRSRHARAERGCIYATYS